MNYKNHKYDNTVIEALTDEHGAQTIKFWKDQGIDTSEYVGNCHKSNNDSSRYYGLINGEFFNYSLKYCIDNIIKIITLPIELEPAIPVEDFALSELESELSKCTQAREYLNQVEFFEALDFKEVLMYLKGREDGLKLAINKLNN